jgi:subtilisin family serine protease
MVSFKPGKGAALPPGIWNLKLTGTVNSNPVIHGWVDPDTGGVMTKQALFVGGDGRGTMEVPALVEQVIAAGAYATSNEELGVPGKFGFFSSQGPLFTSVLLPDPRIKPEITAPGQGIISARAKGTEKPPYNFNPNWVVHSGTSMASPHVVGAIALLLQKEPNLTRQQVRDRLMQSGREDNFTGPFLPDYQWGYGKLDVWKLLHPNVPAPAKAEPAESLQDSSLGNLDRVGSDTDA